MTPPPVSNLFCFTYGESSPHIEIRVDDKLKTVTAKQAKKIADAIMAAGGILCGQCLAESRVRFVRTYDPVVARCADCYDKKTTKGAHY